MIRETAQNPELLALADDVMAWQRQTFSDGTIASAAAHLRSEAVELMACPNDPVEWADVGMLLIAVESHWVAWGRQRGWDPVPVIATKLAVNRTRQWAKNAEGFSEHIREAE